MRLQAAAVVDDLESLGAQELIDHPVGPDFDLDLVVGIPGDQNPFEHWCQEEGDGGHRTAKVRLPAYERVRELPEVRLDYVQRQVEGGSRLAKPLLYFVGKAGLVRQPGQQINPPHEDQIGDVGVVEDRRPGVDAAAEEGGDPAVRGGGGLRLSDWRDDFDLAQGGSSNSHSSDQARWIA